MLTFALIVSSFCASGDAARGSDSLPNIVLITLDTTRADHLGCYGYFRDTSPVIDAFAKESILFERCITPMSTTLPAHLSLLTGTYPYEHGVLANSGEGRFVSSPALRTLTSFCKEAGYATAAFISATPLKKGTGIETDFEDFHQPFRRENIAGVTNEAVLPWLSKVTKTPFFLWVHYFDPHWPYAPPMPYDLMYKNGPELEAYLAARKVPAHAPRELADEVDDARVSTNAYDGEVRYLDSELGRLFEQLKSVPDYDNTVILLVGDHGEGLCQHSEAAHGRTWYEQLWVPMILRVPGEAPRRVSDVISLVDAMPTLLGCIDAPQLNGFLKQSSGRNVLAEQFRSTPVLSSDSGRWLEDSDHKHCVTASRWHYFLVRETASDSSERLFDLSADPFELQNLVTSDRADVTQALASLREALQMELRLQQARGRRFKAVMPSAEKPLDPAVLEQLKSLGYVGEDE